MKAPALTETERAELVRLRADYAVCAALLDELFEPGITKLVRKLPDPSARCRRPAVRSRIVLAAMAVCLLSVVLACILNRRPAGISVAMPNEPPSRAGILTADEEPVRPGTIGVNTATADELTALPGIGPVLAERIVTERTLHGPYHFPADLLRVSGIGPKVLARILPLIHFSTTSPGR